MNRSTLRVATMATTLALLAGGAHAASVPALLTTQDFGFVPALATPDTFGFEFTANSQIMVDQLGVFDSAQDGLAEGHFVGLWDAGGTMLADVIVSSGTVAPLIGLYRYASITPVMLSAGAHYFVGVYSVDFGDPPAIGSQSPITDPRITLVNYGLGNASDFSAPNFVIPPLDYANFTISPVVAVPEPGLWTLMLLGFGGLGVALRSARRGRANVVA